MQGICPITIGHNYSIRCDYQSGTVVSLSVRSLSINIKELIENTSLDLILPLPNYIYFGDEFTDNSYRMYNNATNLIT